MKFSDKYKQIMEATAEEYVGHIPSRAEELAQAIDDVNASPIPDKVTFDTVLKMTHNYNDAVDEKEQKTIYKEMVKLASEIKDENLKRTIEDHLSRLAIDPRDAEKLDKSIPVPEADEEVEVKQ